MSEPARAITSTYAEYLERERQSETKHEFLDGVIYAMAGGTPEHARLAAVVTRTIGTLLLHRPCDVYSSDLMIRVLATGLATYPDLSVICGPLERDPENRNAAINPTVIVEILSDGTEAYDRGEKFSHYRRIPSLREYVLVSQHRPRIEVYRRNEDDSWTLRTAEVSGVAMLASLDVALRVDEVYEGAFPEPPAPESG